MEETVTNWLTQGMKRWRMEARRGSHPCNMSGASIPPVRSVCALGQGHQGHSLGSRRGVGRAAEALAQTPVRGDWRWRQWEESPWVLGAVLRGQGGVGPKAGGTSGTTVGQASTHQRQC